MLANSSMDKTPFFFVTGGTVAPQSPSYVPRLADAELANAIVAGEYCYVLNSRQMGKSSLSVRAMEALTELGIRVAFIDLTKFGGRNVGVEQWYIGLVSEIGRVTGQAEQMLDYWDRHTKFGPMQRFFGALREVCLKESPVPLCLMVDEVDATLSLSFSADEFFAGIRECFNRRAQDPEFKRLTFCLIGVASPSDLIQNAQTTPFNVGRRIELRDFTFQEAQRLQEGLGPNGLLRLRRIFHWTNGHPYLTQAVCDEASKHPKETVDHIVRRLFLTVKARDTDINLGDVLMRLLNGPKAGVSIEEPRAEVLDLCSRIRYGRGSVKDDEFDPMTTHIKLCGLVSVIEGRLRVRNRIYRRTYNKRWIRNNLPDAEARRQKRAGRRSAILATVISCSVLGTGFWLNNKYRLEQNLFEPRPWFLSDIVGERLFLDVYDGTKGIYARHGGKAWIFDMVSGKALVELKGHTEDVYTAGFSKDGRRVVTAAHDGTARVWDVRTGTPLAVIHDFPAGKSISNVQFIWSMLRSRNEPYELKLSDDGFYVIDEGRSLTPRIWSTASGKLVFRSSFLDGSRIAAQQGRRVAVQGSGDFAPVKVYDLLDGHKDLDISFDEARSSYDEIFATFSPKGDLLVIARGPIVMLWDCEGKALRASWRTPRVRLDAVVISDDDSKILAKYGQRIEVRSAGTGRLLRTIDFPAPSPFVFGFDPDGTPVASWRGVKIRLFDKWEQHGLPIATAPSSIAEHTTADANQDPGARPAWSFDKAGSQSQTVKLDWDLMNDLGPSSSLNWMIAPIAGGRQIDFRWTLDDLADALPRFEKTKEIIKTTAEEDMGYPVALSLASRARKGGVAATTLYRQHCAELVIHLETLKDPKDRSPQMVALACVILPDGLQDFEPLLEAYRDAVDGIPQGHARRCMEGMLLYRMGRYEEALEKLALHYQTGPALWAVNQNFLAMCEQRLGHTVTAKKSYEKLKSLVALMHVRPDTVGMDENQRDGTDQYLMLEAEMLSVEADKLINGVHR